MVSVYYTFGDAILYTDTLRVGHVLYDSSLLKRTGSILANPSTLSWMVTLTLGINFVNVDLNLGCSWSSRLCQEDSQGS